MLAEVNKEYFDYGVVAAIFNLKRTENLKWYREIANEKYPSQIQ
jgi:hypothetical protein